MKKLLLLLLCCILSVTAWSIAPHVPRISSISGTYTSTQTLFPFLGNHNLHDLAISGSVTLNSDTSLVRVIMHDINGKSYLLYEASPMLINGYFERFAGANEETEWMCGVVPQDLKIVVKDATCTITGLTATQYNVDHHPLRAPAQRDSIRIRQVQAKVDKINAYNEANGMLWWAGVTSRAKLPYFQKQEMFCANDEQNLLEGIEYYVDGIYEIGHGPLVTGGSSPYVDSFDWRNRHGKDWNSSIKNQIVNNTETNYCWAFTGAATLECYSHLFYNKVFDLDLSEEDIAAHSGARQPNGGGDTFEWQNLICSYAQNDGICMEDDYKLHIPPQEMRTDARPSGCFALKIQNWGRCFNSVFVNQGNIDTIKHHLIHNGPMMSGLYAVRNSNSERNHAMSLVGYGTVHAKDSFVYAGIEHYQVRHISENDRHVGATYWIFKNSMSENPERYKEGGYFRVIFREYEAMYTPVYFASDLSYVNSNDSIGALFTQEIIDRDGDGYYTWGFLQPKPASLPSWVPNEQDGDDSDYTKCTMNDYGFLQDLVYSPNDTIYIDSDQTFCGLKHLYRPIKVQNHATLTIASNIQGHGDASIVLAEGSHLDISDGSIESVSIIGNESSVINLRKNSHLNITRSNSYSVSLRRTQ